MMPSQNTKQLHKLIQDLLSRYHGIPDLRKYGDYGKCLEKIIQETREFCIISEERDALDES